MRVGYRLVAHLPQMRNAERHGRPEQTPPWSRLSCWCAMQYGTEPALVPSFGPKLDYGIGCPEAPTWETEYVLCRRCRKLLADLPPRISRIRRRWRRDAKELDNLLCDRCNALLLADDSVSVDEMLRKLDQLSRFGLGADNRPLLTRERGGT